MTRFRYSGVNWEGRAWQAVAGITTLGKEVETRWPNRHAADGTVAGAGHDAGNPSSDHRPKPYTGFGWVRAIDVGETVENDGATLAEHLRVSRDYRIRYVIHEGRLFSSYGTSARVPWAWGPYSGSNPHASHVHISTVTAPGADTDGSPWGLLTPTPLPTPGGNMDVPTYVRGLRDLHTDAVNANRPSPLVRLRDAGLYGGDPNYWIGLLARPDDPAWIRFVVSLEIEAMISRD